MTLVSAANSLKQTYIHIYIHTYNTSLAADKEVVGGDGLAVSRFIGLAQGNARQSNARQSKVQFYDVFIDMSKSTMQFYDVFIDMSKSTLQFYDVFIIGWDGRPGWAGLLAGLKSWPAPISSPNP